MHYLLLFHIVVAIFLYKFLNTVPESTQFSVYVNIAYIPV